MKIMPVADPSPVRLNVSWKDFIALMAPRYEVSVGLTRTSYLYTYP